MQGNFDEDSIDNMKSAASGKTDFTLRPSADLVVKTVDVGSISIAEDLANSFRKLTGVRTVRMNLLREFIVVDDWLDDRLLDQIGSQPVN